jgi:hypothetical protein
VTPLEIRLAAYLVEAVDSGINDGTNSDGHCRHCPWARGFTFTLGFVPNKEFSQPHHPDCPLLSCGISPEQALVAQTAIDAVVGPEEWRHEKRAERIAAAIAALTAMAEQSQPEATT